MIALLPKRYISLVSQLAWYLPLWLINLQHCDYYRGEIFPHCHICSQKFSNLHRKWFIYEALRWKSKKNQNLAEVREQMMTYISRTSAVAKADLLRLYVVRLRPNFLSLLLNALQLINEAFQLSVRIQTFTQILLCRIPQIIEDNRKV